MHRFRTLLCITALFVFSRIGGAEVLYLGSSDEHSHYGFLPFRVLQSARLRRDFLKRHPNGEVVWLSNGDFAGLSAWTSDSGELGYDALVELAQLYRIQLNPGNHDGFDLLGDEGNLTFLRQNRRLKELSGHSMINANLVPLPTLQPWVRPYDDVPLGNGKVIRTVAMVLDCYFSKCTYDSMSSTQLFAGIRPGLEVAKEQIIKAVKDGVGAVVFAIHDNPENVETLLKRIYAWQKENPAERDVKISFSFSGHQHIAGENLELRRFDSGSNYGFYAVEVDSEGDLKSSAFFPPTLLSGDFDRFADVVDPIELGVMKAAQQVYLEEELINSEILGHSLGFAEIKRNFKAGPTFLGSLAATSIAKYGDERAYAILGAEVRQWEERQGHVFAIFNSSSWRRDIPIPAGPVTHGMIRSAYPLAGKTKLGVFTGRDIGILYASLRRFSAQPEFKTFSPQLSLNLRVHDTAEGPVLLFSPKPGVWLQLEDDETYLMMPCAWLSQNGYRIPEWAEIFARTRWIDADPPLNQRQAMTKYLPKLMEHSGCSRQVEALSRKQNTKLWHRAA